MNLNSNHLYNEGTRVPYLPLITLTDVCSIKLVLLLQITREAINNS